MIRQKIKNAIQKAISLSSLPKESSFLVERPTNFVHGDYYSNVAFVLSKRVSFSPNEIAQILKENLEKERQKIFEKIEVSNGFLNFFLSKDFLLSLLLSLLRKREKFFSILGKKRPKVQVEFISANPTGPLHIGNGRGAFFGDCLANLLETAGYKVEREYFINDGKSNSQIEALGKTALKKGTLYLTPYLKEKLKKLEKKLKKIKEEREAGFFLAQEIQKDIKTFIEKKLKIKFDNWVSEQKLYDQGKVEKVYQFLKKKGLIYEKEGAQWLKISQFGAPKDEVVIRQNGQPTYFLSDIAYHKDKFDRKFKKIINIWGADHQGHVPKIKAITKIFNFKGELVILISQIVTLKGGEKLSKRKGQIVLLEDLIDEVGLDCARFFYLTKSLDTPMEFDFELAKEKSQKNPVFYIQYAFARICSLQNKLKLGDDFEVSLRDLRWLSHPKEITLMKKLLLLPEVIEDCLKDYQIQRIPNYAENLASAFHSFYDECRILGEKKEIQKARIALVLATKIVLKKTLDLMGISAPKKM